MGRIEGGEDQNWAFRNIRHWQAFDPYAGKRFEHPITLPVWNSHSKTPIGQYDGPSRIARIDKARELLGVPFFARPPMIDYLPW